MLNLIEVNEQNANQLIDVYRPIHEETWMLGLESNWLNQCKPVQRHRSQTTCFIAVKEKQMIGFIAIQGHSAPEIKHCASLSIGVLKAFRGNGYGKMILEKAEQWAHGHDIFRLEACVGYENRAALLLFGTSGYSVEGIRKEAFQRDGAMVDAFYMAKCLKKE
ncbi:GNAT family N-acetyltransferase [Sporolactobacillus terrae]|uniref:GNAT family N-acetyltransferase n=1 Tax=Sporolactobacillus terrae TaxID=269673 RepID=A0ABX5Q6G8_9BACL|nr:GNAT family N-acetyltransferase [Sporolactobacillus terrae]QAA22240.1 GNAT family N-acetyltransferase [Sporolactobacillus terrae]QAA25214.1 GNAT family N-acetyltransferase [Sporolactobacillus terrae]UAK17030.1 GNAT family N-acetyltransferase [Sporolactobacillus terrae]